ncbi:MAG TPA: phosphate acyltransferase PlsX [Gammaproteobacteria bacterium]|mgnify:CR=1 FL=1|nr:phosphate acyltransferase PlsX [Gammaproteobacteria bacterium]
MAVSIAVDIMGGDVGANVTIPASSIALKRHAGLSLYLVGDEVKIAAHITRLSRAERNRCKIIHAPQQVEMSDKPSIALRNRRESSMRLAIDLVKDGHAHAAVSAGNTGALMAIARFVLKTIPGIDRPAICGIMPGIYGATHMLDLGANVDSSAEELFRFGVMGSVLASAIGDKERPTVALLNIGEEEMKGNERVKQAATLLEASELNYFGYVEGDDIFKGKVDVVVCDGFVGNVALKSSEGVARMLTEFARDEFSRNVWRKLSTVFSKRALTAIRNRADPGRYNGASLLGLKGIVVKSHGGADSSSFASAINAAVIEIKNNVPQLISNQIEKTLTRR